jgi:hypothetical protein
MNAFITIYAERSANVIHFFLDNAERSAYYPNIKNGPSRCYEHLLSPNQKEHRTFQMATPHASIHPSLAQDRTLLTITSAEITCYAVSANPFRDAHDLVCNGEKVGYRRLTVCGTLL